MTMTTTHVRESERLAAAVLRGVRVVVTALAIALAGMLASSPSAARADDAYWLCDEDWGGISNYSSRRFSASYSDYPSWHTATDSYFTRDGNPYWGERYTPTGVRTFQMFVNGGYYGINFNEAHRRQTHLYYGAPGFNYWDMQVWLWDEPGSCW